MPESTDRHPPSRPIWLRRTLAIALLVPAGIALAAAGLASVAGIGGSAGGATFVTLVMWLGGAGLLSMVATAGALRLVWPATVWQQLGLLAPRAMPVTEVVQELRDAAPYLQVMGGQLSGAVDVNALGTGELLKLLEDLLRASTEVQGRVQTSTRNALTLLELLKEKTALDEQLRLILETFVQRQEEDGKSHIARLERLHKVKDLHALVDVVSMVAQQTNFLAINAAIEAARAGPAGKGFAVVAGEVRALSVRASAAARSMSEQITAATQGIDVELASVQAAASRRESIGGMRRVLDDVGQMQDRFKRSARETDIEAVFRQLADGHRATVELLTEAFGKFQFHDVLAQRVRQVQAALSELEEHLQGIASQLDTGTVGPGSGITLRERLDRQVGAYVMQSQQDTHTGVTLGAPAAPGNGVPAIELF